MRRRIKEIQRWGAHQLEEADRAFLASFQTTVALPLAPGTDLLCYHGSPRSNEEGLYCNTSEEKLEEILAEWPQTLLAGGHTHRPMLRRWGEHTLLNPGSVGAPVAPQEGASRPPWAEYALVDCSGGRLGIELRRVPLERNLLTEAARASGIPHPDWWLALRYGPIPC